MPLVAVLGVSPVELVGKLQQCILVITVDALGVTDAVSEDLDFSTVVRWHIRDTEAKHLNLRFNAPSEHAYFPSDAHHPATASGEVVAT